MAVFGGTIHSKSIKMNTRLNVILPEYGEKADGTLILLHGQGDNADAWTRYTGIDRFAKRHNLAVFMPEVQRSWYTDMAYGLKYFTYITDELPGIIGRMFPTAPVDAARLYVGGLSMGGYGAMKCALTYPERVAGAIILSARLYLDDKIGGLSGEDLDEFRPILGMDLEIPKENDLEYLLDRAVEGGRMPRLYMACGRSDHLYEENLRMRDRLREKKVDFTYEEWEGIHSWDFWDVAIQRGLDAVMPKRA